MLTQTENINKKIYKNCKIKFFLKNVQNIFEIQENLRLTQKWEKIMLTYNKY